MNLENEFVPKKITLNSACREKLAEGARIVAETVGLTMGPSGKLVIFDSIESIWPLITKDGVTVAKQIILEDSEMSLGAEMLKQAAVKQVKLTGDGTTLTTVLSYEILKQGLATIRSGANPQSVQKGMRKAMHSVIAHLKAGAKPVTDNERAFSDIATIATNNDPELGELIGKALFEVGPYGMVTHDKSAGETHELIHERGYNWDTSIDNYFFNTNLGVHLPDPVVLVTEYELSWARDILSIMSDLDAEAQATKIYKPLVIICPDINKEARAAIMKMRKDGYAIVHVKPEGTAMAKRMCYEDISAYTGATFLSNDCGIPPSKFKKEHLGRAHEIRGNASKCLLVEYTGDDKKTEPMTKRVDLLKSIVAMATPTQAYEKQLAEKSIARLIGGFAIVKAGGMTESDKAEKVDRIDDAIKAVLAAKEEGIVAGGGVALLKASQFVASELGDNGDRDFAAGWNIIVNAIKAPVRKILSNADNENMELIFSQLKSSKFNSYDVNASEAEKETMFSKHIIDPLKVVRTSLLIATTTASQMLQTGGIVTVKPEEVKK